jgi:hypothetical protein
MSTTVIDPTDGTAYDLVRLGGKWDICEAGTDRRPAELDGTGPWDSPEQALQALRTMCAAKEPVHRTARGPGQGVQPFAHGSRP